MPKTKILKHMDAILPDGNVAEYRPDILDAGTELASLLKLKLPGAKSVSNSLFDVVKVVETYNLKKKWVKSWASSAMYEYVMTHDMRKASNVTFSILNVALSRA